MVNQNYTQQEKLELQMANEMLIRAIQATDMGSDWPIFREPLDTVNPRVLRDVLERNGIKRFIIASVFPELLQYLQYFTGRHMDHPNYYIKAVGNMSNPNYYIQAAGNMGDDEYYGEIPGIFLVNSDEWEEYVEIEHRRINFYNAIRETLGNEFLHNFFS